MGRLLADASSSPWACEQLEVCSILTGFRSPGLGGVSLAVCDESYWPGNVSALFARCAAMCGVSSRPDGGVFQPAASRRLAGAVYLLSINLQSEPATLESVADFAGRALTRVPHSAGCAMALGDI